MTPEAVILNQVSKAVGDAHLLDRASLRVAAGEQVAIMGRSGVGKTTLLHLASGMDQPDHGQILVAGRCISEMDEPERTQWRAQHVGLVFQDFNLIDGLTVEENIALPLWLCGQKRTPSRIQAMAQSLDIQPLLSRLPHALSGGEKQRVAIARALIHRPSVVLADEPTGSLDEANADVVLEMFSKITRQFNCAVLMVTHHKEAAATADRVLQLKEGQLQAVADL